MDRLIDYFAPSVPLGNREKRHRIAAALARPQLFRNAVAEAVSTQDVLWLETHLALRQHRSVPYQSWLLAGVYERATGHVPTRPATRMYATLHVAMAVLLVRAQGRAAASHIGHHVASAVATWPHTGEGIPPSDPQIQQQIALAAGSSAPPAVGVAAIAHRLACSGLDSAPAATLAIADLLTELTADPEAIARSGEVRCLVPVVGPDNRPAEVAIHAEARPWPCRALYQHPHYLTEIDDKFQVSVDHAWSVTRARCEPQAPPVALRWWLTTADEAIPVPSIGDVSAGVGLALTFCRALNVDWRPRTRLARERASRRLVTGRVDSDGAVRSLEPEAEAGSPYADKRDLIKNRPLVVPNVDLDRVQRLLKGARGFQRVYGAGTLRDFDRITKRSRCRPLFCVPAALVTVGIIATALAVWWAGGGVPDCAPTTMTAAGAAPAQIQVPGEGVRQADCVRGVIHELATQTIGHVVVRGDDDFPRYFAQGRPLGEGPFAVCSAFGRSADDAPGQLDGSPGADVGKVFQVLVVQADDEATRLLRQGLLDNRGLLELPAGATVLALVEVQRTADGARCAVIT